MNVRSLRFRITAWYAGLMAGALLTFAGFRVPGLGSVKAT